MAHSLLGHCSSVIVSRLKAVFRQKILQRFTAHAHGSRRLWTPLGSRQVEQRTEMASADSETTLQALPAELLVEVAARCPLRCLVGVVRFDVPLAARLRLQRWFRSWHRPTRTELCVGDRVLARSSTRKLIYATAAAASSGDVWKLLVRGDEYISVHRSQILRRLIPWADGPWDCTVGRDAALESASRTRSAATQAAYAATESMMMHSGGNGEHTALAFSAAVAASSAAVVATAASSSCAPEASQAVNVEIEARELIAAMQQMAIAAVGGLGCTGPSGASSMPFAVVEAMAAAVESAAEAEAATYTASAAVSAGLRASTDNTLDALEASASAASAVAAAAQQLSSAAESLGEVFGAEEGAAASVASAEAVTEAIATGRMLSATCNTGLGETIASSVLLAAAAHGATCSSECWSFPQIESWNAVQGGVDELVRDGASSILWCWLPRSNSWTLDEVLERTTRAVAACRSRDLIALPNLRRAHELVDYWSRADCGTDHLNSRNVIWFDPCVAVNPVMAVLVDVLEEYKQRGHAGGSTALYCMYPDASICRVAAAYGLRCLGDLDAHPIVGSLRGAKSFLHPSLSQPLRPSLQEAKLGKTVRGPRGFICDTPEQLQDAWERLTGAGPHIKIVLKPANGSGGKGVVLNATAADVASLRDLQGLQRAEAEVKKGRFTVKRLADATIVEEMVGAQGKPSPTVYMVGSRVATVADQILAPCGTVTMGNIAPASHVPSSVIGAMSRACISLGRYLGLRGQWGADFALDDNDSPVMVDLNMGRPNASLSYYCWRARQQPLHWPTSSLHDLQDLYMITTTLTTPKEVRIKSLAVTLKARGLLWNSRRGDGVVLAQHLPGVPRGGKVIIASWESPGAAWRILNEFRNLVKFASLGTVAA